MEIKAQLNKPYTDKQRVDFIVENNHKLGYEIRETEIALEAWGYTEEEKEQQEIKKRKQEILNLLDKLDLKSIRAIRANDTEYINKYEEEAEALREELRNL